jgi:hypothetical protein
MVDKKPKPWSDRKFTYFMVGLLLIFMAFFGGNILTKLILNSEYYEDVNMSPRTEIPFAPNELVKIPDNHTWATMNAWDLHLINSSGKTIKLVYPPDYGTMMPIPGKVKQAIIIGNTRTERIQESGCVPVYIFIYNNTTFSQTKIPQTTMCG